MSEIVGEQRRRPAWKRWLRRIGLALLLGIVSCAGRFIYTHHKVTARLNEAIEAQDREEPGMTRRSECLMQRLSEFDQLVHLYSKPDRRLAVPSPGNTISFSGLPSRLNTYARVVTSWRHEAKSLPPAVPTL